ncbi:hypothetical protein O3G_MSEX009063 [Manduca sexta]|uniref:Mitochondrial cardiolipin hydrolase n=1 Tax=Manduca sexta TaxID=7130 RepID=A0A921ZBX6_MANSE|nr:hypothetical protein O3G_MSEX009063 [Manduca sexta]
MRLNPRILSSVAAFAITCVVYAAAYYYKSRNTAINEVMVFCKLQYNAHNCFDKLMSYVESAKSNVNVCMPGIHNAAIQGRLINILKKKNITIRIIVDQHRCNESNEFFIKELKEAGAEIKYKITEPFKMQHKFCLVDDRVLMTGTLNWGNDRSSDHWNYVYITNKSQLVDPIKKEFYQMWDECLRDLGHVNDKDNENVLCDTENNQNIEDQTKSETILRDTGTPEVYIM